jgi:glucose-6-phosphate 1-dehydrogenase
VFGAPDLRLQAMTELWRIVEPVLKAWANDEVPLGGYPAGSFGPASTVAGRSSGV